MRYILGGIIVMKKSIKVLVMSTVAVLGLATSASFVGTADAATAQPAPGQSQPEQPAQPAPKKAETPAPAPKKAETPAPKKAEKPAPAPKKDQTPAPAQPQQQAQHAQQAPKAGLAR